MHTLTSNVSVEIVPVDGTNYTVAAGTGDTLTATEIDTQGYDGVVIGWVLGTVSNGAVLTPTVKNSNTSGSYGTGTVDNVWTPGDQTYATGANASNRFIRVDIVKPQRRYMRAALQRATANAAVLALVVVKYRVTSAPVSQGTGAGQVVLEARLNSPTPSAV